MRSTLCDPGTTAHKPGFPVHHQILEFTTLMSIELVMPLNYLILCHPLLLLPSIFPSIRGFSSELVLHIRKPKFWSFSFSISPYNEYSGLFSFMMTCLISSQESSATPQFKSISSSGLSFLHSPPFTPICDYWKNHSFD